MQNMPELFIEVFNKNGGTLLGECTVKASDIFDLQD